MINYTIGAVKKKKKSTASKSKKSKPYTMSELAKMGPQGEYRAAPKLKKSAKGRKPTAGSKISKNGERYFPSTAPKSKTYKVSSTCSTAGAGTKAGSKTAAGVLALCRASVKNLKTTAAALKKYGVTKGRLSRRK